MMSKRCFFRMMKEDFRHKIWMLALSVLGSMLAIPVLYLISTGQPYDPAVTVWSLTYQAGAIAEFFSNTLMVSGGIVTIAGALIVGLSGFRYVFHRNMVDTYHSIPVRRSTYFWINWLNGFLIWLVPFLAALSLTLLLGLGRLGSLKGRLAGLVMNEEERILVTGWATGGRLFVSTLVSLLALTVAFLLVYHLVLLAVMLCGNVLNTLVTAAALGAGAISVYLLFLTFCARYFDTFVSSAADGYKDMAYASPLVSSVILLYRRAAGFGTGEGSGFWGVCILNLLIALAMGAFSLLAYLKRPSELAEQGLRIRPVRFPVQIMVSLAAAMGGWMLFYCIGNSAELIWGIFGAVLAGGVSFGVMDIIFHMEFKSFFAHKALMGLTVAAGVFIGFLFYYDWPGYDRYLPDREEIAEIAVYDNFHCNVNTHIYDIYDAEHPVNRVCIRDSAAAYAFLESVTDPDNMETEGDELYYTEELLTKVTLKSGRVYYRTYRIHHGNSAAALALLSSPEYLDVNFRIGQEERDIYKSISLYRGGFVQELQLDTQEGARLFEAVCEAYNRDLEENPEAFICGDGRLFCSIRFWDKAYNHNRYLEVFEGMEHVREALRQHGFAQFAGPVEPEAVEEIQLSLGYIYPDTGDKWDPVAAAREVYGVWPKEKTLKSAEQAVDFGTYSGTEEVVLHITDEEEIRELLELISYDEGRYYRGAFRLDGVDYVTMAVSGEEEKLSVNIPFGTLPEKYILRFGAVQP